MPKGPEMPRTVGELRSSDLPSGAYGGALEKLGNIGELIKRIEPRRTNLPP